ncbi:MAG: vitamin K epoxide reductase family protein [Actinobacteria bacterium]|nr:vitamin K epoxide reductase family protein [Actinomycetota bacterium]
MATSDLEFAEEAVPSAPDKHRGAFLEMLISSAIGLYASMVLSIEAVTLAANPDAALSCNISDKISCGAVGVSWQAELLGFPNAFLGLIAEAVVITVAVAALGGVKFPRWFMLLAQGIYAIGFVFAYWLFWQSFTVIGALCPWCLLITVTTTLVFVSLTRVNILDGNFGERVRKALTPALRVGVDVWTSLLLIAILAALVIVEYV